MERLANFQIPTSHKFASSRGFRSVKLATQGMQRMDEEPRPKVDLASVLYIAFGVPGIVGFLVILFAFMRACDIPA